MFDLPTVKMVFGNGAPKCRLYWPSSGACLYGKASLVNGSVVFAADGGERYVIGGVDLHVWDGRELQVLACEKLVGRLMDYDSGEEIGPATRAQRDASRLTAASDGGAGVILVDEQGLVVRPDDPWLDDAQRCYVEE